MKYMKGSEIRKMWLDFFKSKGHEVEPGASLVPVDDKSLLWMNAGVTPLKKYFDGRKTPKCPRICNAQKCIRTNDIENVGKTSRHQTFFEMLGNFSIGDYFRSEVIPWAFELLTSDKWFGFSKDELFITYYPDDQDTFNTWVNAGMDPSHMVKCSGNFWEIGEGPCGPDTEIFFDRGPKYGDFTSQAIADDIENDRYIEIWNIVFSQYNSDGSGNRSEYKLLPNKNIDTGSGLERLASVMQGVETNFDTDLFMPIINAIEGLSGVKYEGQSSYKIIADHIRTITFALADGALFSNEGRGYVLRRLLRRAVKHGLSLGIKKPFLSELVDVVAEIMIDFYPNLEGAKELSKKLIKQEEVKFFNTLDAGLEKFNGIVSKGVKEISGQDAFVLFDTYGFPLELTEEYASEKGITVDKEGFQKEMELQKERARSSRSAGGSFMKQNEEYLNFKTPDKFVGYEKLVEDATVIKVFEGGFVTDQTPFYSICGGQVGDSGSVTLNGNTYAVTDTLTLPNKQHLHVVENPYLFNVGDKVTLTVDEERRTKIMLNHSCCHLMFKALREVLGSHVSQQGSEITPEMLRFDFNHYEPLTEAQILKVEELTNSYINQAIKSDIREMSIEDATKTGAVAEFGEKYGDTVRVVNLGVTVDFCGGTHVQNTKDIEKFMVLSISSIGSGIYRVQGLTASNIDIESTYFKSYQTEFNKLIDKAHQIENKLAEKNINLKFGYEPKLSMTGSYKDVLDVRKEHQVLIDKVKDFDKEANKLLSEKDTLSFESYKDQIVGNKCILNLDSFDRGKLRQLADYVSSFIPCGTVVIIDKVDGKAQIVCKNTNPAKDASQIVRTSLQLLGGNGGGKKEFAQGGAQSVENIDQVLEYLNKELN